MYYPRATSLRGVPTTTWMVSKSPSDLSNGFTAKCIQIVLADCITTVDPNLAVNRRAWKIYSHNTIFQSIMPGNWARLLFNMELGMKGAKGALCTPNPAR